MNVLITMPNYDDATSYLYCYAEELIKFAEKEGISTLQFKRPRLERKKVELSITQQQPKLLLFNAHGDEHTIYGDKIDGEEEYLIREEQNHHLLSGRLVYARACSAAASLGVACTEHGGCFIGYNQPFSFWTDTSRTTTPLKDKIAELFLKPSNELALALLRGKSAQQSAEIYIHQSKKNMLRLLSKKDEPGALASAMLLWNNMIGQEVLGDGEMKFF